jgi:hypothetical protein
MTRLRAATARQAKSEIGTARADLFVIRASDFLRHSLFGIRHLFS